MTSRHSLFLCQARKSCFSSFHRGGRVTGIRTWRARYCGNLKCCGRWRREHHAMSVIRVLHDELWAAVAALETCFSFSPGTSFFFCSQPKLVFRRLESQSPTDGIRDMQCELTHKVTGKKNGIGVVTETARKTKTLQQLFQ